MPKTEEWEDECICCENPIFEDSRLGLAKPTENA